MTTSVGRTLRGKAALGLAATLLLASCAFVGDLLHGTRDRIVFSHQQHLDLTVKGHAGELKMCATCHFATPGDVRGEEPGMPLEAQCLTCHKDWKSQNQCTKCHTDADKPLTYAAPTTPPVKFSHARHNERIERLEDHACDYCHESAWKEGHDTAGLRLTQDREEKWHETCFKCHLMRTEWDRMNCAKCHEQMSDRAGPKPLSRFRHGGDWLGRHGDDLASRPDGIALCAKCHDHGYCIDCHDARDESRIRPELKWPDRPDRAFIHRGDYVNRHAMEARAAPADCLRCHAVQGFCLECHERKGLTIGTRALAQGSDRNRFGAGGKVDAIQQYHNATYADFMNPQAPGFHGRSARRDAVLCASCHDQGPRSVCVDCHADSQVKAPRIAGGNPHPIGFKSAIPKSSRPCSYCHLYAGGR